MRKKAKRMKLVTAPLTWGDFIRGKAVKGEDGGWGMGEERREMIEALAQHFFFLEKTLLLRKSLYGKFASPKTCAKRITRLR